MRTGRPKAELELSPQEEVQLSSLAASRALPHALVARAKLVLWAAASDSNRTIAQRLSWSMPTVGKWRRRFVDHRLAGLHDELRAGRPRTYHDEQVAGLINRVLHSQPKAATHWSVRSMADETGISKSTVARYFALFGFSRIALRASSFPPTLFLSRRCVTWWWGSTSIRPTRRWSCVWTRRARSRPSSARSLCSEIFPAGFLGSGRNPSFVDIFSKSRFARVYRPSKASNSLIFSKLEK